DAQVSLFPGPGPHGDSDSSGAAARSGRCSRAASKEWNMTMRLRVSAVWTGLALVLVTNALVLGHVLLNRNRDPESTLSVSERELQLPFNWGMVRENSGISLRIDYQVPT